MAKLEPSPRQRQIVDAVAEHGSVAAVAAALGISVLNVDRALSAYHLRVCTRRFAELEAESERHRERLVMDSAAHRLERVLSRIEQAVLPVNHRRLADGGVHVSAQIKDLRRRRDRGDGDATSLGEKH